MADTDTVAAFLPYTISQKSVSLIIADSDAAADAAVKELEDKGYMGLAGARDLRAEGMRYARISSGNAKEMYDLAIQYGTGQVGIFDTEAHKNSWINPQYNKAALIFVVTKADLESIESSGLPMRMATGMATQIYD